VKDIHHKLLGDSRRVDARICEGAKDRKIGSEQQREGSLVTHGRVRKAIVR
jgi:hypothetical protein